MHIFNIFHRKNRPRFYRVIGFECPDCAIHFDKDLRVVKLPRKLKHFHRYWAAECPICRNEILSDDCMVVYYNDHLKIG